MPLQTSLLIILASAAACSAAALGLAARLRLAHRARAALAPAHDPAAVIDDLAALAQLARDRGLLAAAADDRAGAYPLIKAGVHLLLRDADEHLLRSSLEARRDSLAGNAAPVRAFLARACPVFTLALAVAAAIGAAALAAAGHAPAGLTALPAGAVLAAVTAFFAWQAVSAPLSCALRRRNALEVFMADASLRTMLAIEAGEDAYAAARRMSDLFPIPAPSALAAAA